MVNFCPGGVFICGQSGSVQISLSTSKFIRENRKCIYITDVGFIVSSKDYCSSYQSESISSPTQNLQKLSTALESFNA